MADFERLRQLQSEATDELIDHILPYWMQHTVDDEKDGFVGQILHDNRVISDADKGAVLNTRLLWTFAAAYRIVGNEAYRIHAERACHYLNAHFWDTPHGGLFWMLDAQGRPVDTKKQIYAQAFAIYAYSEYYRMSEDSHSLERAIALFWLIEHHSFDPADGGYFEAYGQDWKLLEDLRLSDKDANEKKTMNTHLHVLEAYTNLYRVWPDAVLKQQLEGLIELFLTTILDPQTNHLHLFFDEHWTRKSNIVSFGHDIEASWLLTEAAHVVGAPRALSERVQRAAVRIAEVTLTSGLDPDGGMLNEQVGSHIDGDKYWWPQAEAVVGFLNAYQLTQQQTFLDAAWASWDFIKASLVDRVQGEWFDRVSRDRVPYALDDKVGPWKGPYHNSRMCLEIMERVEG
jgi:mannobiose 2-epimerase